MGYTSASTGSTYTPLTPVRVLDTRTGPGAVGKIGPNQSATLTVAGAGLAVPAGAKGVILNVTVVDGTAGSFFAVYPADASLPVVSNLNFGGGQIIANMVVAKLSADGSIKIYNANGATNVIADVVGYLS